MPFKSQAQRRKFAELLVQGKISPDTFEEWNRETGSRKLPERAAGRGRGAKTKARVRSKSAVSKKPGTRKKSAARKKSNARRSARRRG